MTCPDLSRTDAIQLHIDSHPPQASLRTLPSSKQLQQQFRRPFRCGWCASNRTLLAGIGIEECGDGDNDVGGDQEGALEVIAAAVEDEEVDDERGNEEGDGLEEIEVEGHVLGQGPAEEDNDGRDEEGCARSSVNACIRLGRQGRIYRFGYCCLQQPRWQDPFYSC